MSEYTGKDVSYYLVPIPHPKRLDPYTAECEDLIEALGMTFAEGCAFKAIWRKCAARTLGLAKAGYKGGLYDAEKAQYYGARMVVQETRLGSTPDQPTEDALCLIDNCAVCGIDQNGDPDLHYVGCPNLTATPEFQAEVDATMGEVFADEDQPDMSDPATWRAGDMVKYGNSGNTVGMTIGGLYTLVKDGPQLFFLDDDGDMRKRNAGRVFKWHSRPAK
jgi:hypothetical protein